MSTMIAGESSPTEIYLTEEQQSQKLVKVGPSLQGCVYRSLTAPVCYRRLALDSEAPLDRRQKIRDWVGKPMPPGVAPISKAFQEEESSGYFFVRYQVPQFQCTLSEVLQDSDPSQRLAYLIQVVQALPLWWGSLYKPLLPMPADIAFTSEGKPFLLALPYWGCPRVETVLAEPVTGYYLAPEFICGSRNLDAENLDRYALGVSLLQGSFRFPAVDDAGALLLRAATGTIFEPANLINVLPYWMEHLKSTKRGRDAIFRLLAKDPEARGPRDLEPLARRLEQWQASMDPKQAALELRNQNKFLEALALLQDTLLTQDSYELLTLTGEISGRFLSRHLEAIHF